MADKREFFVDTPFGRLRATAKSDYCNRNPDGIDDPENFPGIFIDLILPGQSDDDYGELLCVVEYESVSECLQSIIYQPMRDDPVSITVHELDEEESE